MKAILRAVLAQMVVQDFTNEDILYECLSFFVKKISNISEEERSKIYLHLDEVLDALYEAEKKHNGEFSF